MRYMLLSHSDGRGRQNDEKCNGKRSGRILSLCSELIDRQWKGSKVINVSGCCSLSFHYQSSALPSFLLSFLFAGLARGCSSGHRCVCVPKVKREAKEKRVSGPRPASPSSERRQKQQMATMGIVLSEREKWCSAYVCVERRHLSTLRLTEREKEQGYKSSEDFFSLYLCILSS